MYKHILLTYFILCVLILCNSCKIEGYSFSYSPTLLEEDSILKEDCDYIIVIGDTQVYTLMSKFYSYYASTMDWIWSQVKHGKNIKCVLHVGDVTESNSPEQYEIFHRVTRPTAELIPYIVCTGNHDYEWDVNNKIVDRYSSRLFQYASFDITKNRVVSQFETGQMENIIVENYINGERFDIISLEFGPRPEVIEWAKQHIQAHPKIKYILLNHEYLTSEGQLISVGSTAELQFESRPHSTPEQLWQQLVNDLDNIACVICGHNGFSQHLLSKNCQNHDVAQVLFNLQYQPHGGDGWVQIWEFSPNSEYVNVGTYNTITRQYYSEADHSFQFKYKY